MARTGWQTSTYPTPPDLWPTIELAMSGRRVSGKRIPRRRLTLAAITLLREDPKLLDRAVKLVEDIGETDDWRLTTYDAPDDLWPTIELALAGRRVGGKRIPRRRLTLAAVTLLRQDARVLDRAIAAVERMDDQPGS